MEPRICVFKVSIVTADNVWTANACKEGSRAAVTLRFPGQDASESYQSAAVLPSSPAQDPPIANADELPSLNQKSDAKKDRIKAEQIAASLPNPSQNSPSSVSFGLQALSDYARASEWPLWQQLVSDPLMVSLLWISPSSQTSTVVGTVNMDLSELLFSKELCWERDCVIEPVFSGISQAESKPGLPIKKDGATKASSKGKKGNAADEVPPSLCPGATMKLQITLDTPILLDNERDEGVLLTLSNFSVVRVPSHYAGSSASSASYSLAFEIPGFTGSWWSNLSIAKQDVKESLGVARIHGGMFTVSDDEAENFLLGDQFGAASETAGGQADGDYLSSNKCYEEGLYEDAKNPDIWLQYGLFFMRGTQKDHGKAEECFREAVNLQRDHALSLLALASLMWHRAFFQQAEVLLNVIIDLHSREEAIAWVLLGQVLLCVGDHLKDASNCFTRAESLFVDLKDVRCSTSALLKYPFSLCHSILESHNPDNPYVATALLLLDLHLPKEAQAILSNEHAAVSCTADYKMCQGRAHELLDNYAEAERFMKEAIRLRDAQGAVWMLLGHLYFKSSQYQRAIDAYEKMRLYGTEQPFFVLGCLELGKSYLESHQIDNGKQVFLDICSLQPSGSSWLGAGITFFEANDLVQAEAAFVEGNVMDPWNFKLWAYLALTCLRTNRMEAAEFACNQALQLSPFLPLLIQMAEYFYEQGNIRVGEKALLKACERTGDGEDIEQLWRCGSWQERVGLVKGNVCRTMLPRS